MRGDNKHAVLQEYTEMQMRRDRRNFDITPGERFGNIVAIERKKNGDRYSPLWICRCDCGKIIERRQEYLKNPLRQVQGCKVCNAKARSARKTTDWPHFQGVGDLGIGMFNNIKNSAIRRGYEFDITVEFAWELLVKQDHKCALTGIPIKIATQRKVRDGAENSASLDRINPAIGYLPNNVQWLHKDVNLMKNSFDEDYFKEICRLIIEKDKKA